MLLVVLAVTAQLSNAIRLVVGHAELVVPTAEVIVPVVWEILQFWMINWTALEPPSNLMQGTD